MTITKIILIAYVWIGIIHAASIMVRSIKANKKFNNVQDVVTQATSFVALAASTIIWPINIWSQNKVKSNYSKFADNGTGELFMSNLMKLTNENFKARFHRTKDMTEDEIAAYKYIWFKI